MNELEAVYRMITVDLHPDDPGPTPPSWAEQEWCDGGTCEHEVCQGTLLDEDYDAFRPGQRVQVHPVPGGFVVIPLDEDGRFEIELSDEPIEDACSCGSRMPCLSPMIKCFHPMRARP